MKHCEIDLLLFRVGILCRGSQIPFTREIDRGAMERVYRCAMKLAIASPSPKQPFSTNVPGLLPRLSSSIPSNSHLVFVSDFDSTITVSDSCPALADLSVSTAEKAFTTSGRPPKLPAVACLRDQWGSLVDQYSQEYTRLLDRLFVVAEEWKCSRDSQQQRPDYNPQLSRRFLDQLVEFEVTANSRVVESGVLAGMSMADIKHAGTTIPFREGCEAFLDRICHKSLPVEFHVLSVCWSQSFIEGSFFKHQIQCSNIHCNELRFNVRGLSTGHLVRRIETAVDKEKVFLEIVNLAEVGLDSSMRTLSVYVGDSPTDLLCLLKADIGIVMGDDRTLERVANACGVTILPLYSGLLQVRQQSLFGGREEKRSWAKEEGVLYRSSTWLELSRFFLGSYIL